MFSKNYSGSNLSLKIFPSKSKMCESNYEKNNIDISNPITYSPDIIKNNFNFNDDNWHDLELIDVQNLSQLDNVPDPPQLIILEDVSSKSQTESSETEGDNDDAIAKSETTTESKLVEDLHSSSESLGIKPVKSTTSTLDRPLIRTKSSVKYVDGGVLGSQTLEPQQSLPINKILLQDSLNTLQKSRSQTSSIERPRSTGSAYQMFQIFQT